MPLSESTTAIVVASISAGIALASAVLVQFWKRRSDLEVERLKAKLSEERDIATEGRQAEHLIAKYRDPLLRSAYALQSRLYNILSQGYAGRREPDYFRLSTLFVAAEFFGWLEIIRRELQFLDLGGVESTKMLQWRLDRIQHEFATNAGADDYYIYRMQQRAIGELMISRLDTPGLLGPHHECMGYASFVAKLSDPEFEKWFRRLNHAVERLPGKRPARLIAVQNALIDLIDFLDQDRERIVSNRDRLPTDSLDP